ncbi:MAG: toll/interleukin-1 receptor domain-containing protein [Candidatus Omnitrophica bacterium]|nr:toll/interleukin-1 receptor domain-containing protein [Candidatus Omnitrophota bacterium]
MKVFISHSTKDMDLVNDFTNILKHRGIEAYVALSDARPGLDLWEKIESNIKDSNCVLAILTQNGSRSEIVNQEIATAKALYIPFIPIVEKGITLKGLLAGREYIEFDKSNPDLTYINANHYIEKLKLQFESKEFLRVLLVIAVIVIGLYLLSKYVKK